VTHQEEGKLGWLELGASESALSGNEPAIRPRNSPSVTQRERPRLTGCCDSAVWTERAASSPTSFAPDFT
jgi:hypothetical protein